MSDQDTINKLVLNALAAPQVRDARESARKILESNPLASLPDGRARLDYALDAWLTFLAYKEANADPARPRVVWSPNGATYSWLGQTVPVTGASIDCPDNIYRLIPLDASSRYEVHGQLRPMHPAQFSFQLLRDAEMAPSGNDSTSLGVLNSRDMVLSPEGSFTITLDAEPVAGRSNHLQLTPGPLLRLLLRDTLSSWQQSANTITIQRLIGPLELESLLPADSLGITHDQRDRDRQKRRQEWGLRLATDKRTQ
jgi:hypothetical protein